MGAFVTAGGNTLATFPGTTVPGLAPTAPALTGSMDNALSGQTKQAIGGFTNPDGQTKNTAIPLTTATVQPVSGQPSNVPDSNPDPNAFSVDTYRYGNAGGTDSETTAPMQLSDDLYKPDQLANMTLTVADPSSLAATETPDYITAYSRFFLQSVVEAEQEKYQIVETFTGYYAFFFGKKPPIYRYSGLLLNDQNYRWNNDFKFVYENFFRGTSATELNSQVIMNYDSRIITGFPLSLTMQQEAANEKGIPFSMDLLVVDHQVANYSADIAQLIAQKQQQLADQLAAIQSIATIGSSQTVLTSDLTTNGLYPASSVRPPTTLPSSFGSVDQTALS